MEIIKIEDTLVNQARETMGLKILLDMAEEFFSDPENRAGFEAWKKEKEGREAV